MQAILAKRKMVSWNKGKHTGIIPKSAYKKGEKRQLGANHHSWKGGLSHKEGYITRYIPPTENGKRGQLIPEHRYVMEQYLGRKLKRTEIVHHINEIKTDNRIENLQLFKSVTDHLKHHHSNKRLLSKSCPGP